MVLTNREFVRRITAQYVHLWPEQAMDLVIIVGRVYREGLRGSLIPEPFEQWMESECRLADWQLILCEDDRPE